MAKIVNIRRDVDDKFYRYKMPELMTKIEGKGNGIKTVLPNMTDVSRALSRPPTYPTKFFGSELGAQTPIDEKNDRYIVNGAHEAGRLRELLDVFIDKFVLCAKCKNPETDLIIDKNDNIYRDCKACGRKTDIDMRHKLTTYILRNPPKSTKGEKKGAHATANNAGGTGTPDEENAGLDDDPFTQKIRSEAADLPMAGQAKVDENDWSLDTSAEAVRERARLAAGIGGLSLGDGDDSDSEDVNSPYNQFAAFLGSNRSTASAVEVFKMAQDLGIEKKHKTLQVIGRSLFDANIVEEVNANTVLLKKMVTSEKHQKSLMGGIEALIGLDYPELVPTIPKVLMALYQGDVLNEEFIKQWGTHTSKKYVDKDISKKVRKASEPFLKWLEEADDDDDDDDDE